MIARGSAFWGFLTSSPAVDTASRPMKEKKIVPAAAVMPAEPAAQKLSKRSAWKAVRPMMTKRMRTLELDQHHHRVDLRRLAGAADQQQGAQEDQHDGRQVDQALGAAVDRDRRVGQRVRDLHADRLVEQLVEVAAPADRDGAGRDAVLEEHAGGDHHRDQLAEGVVGVGVRRPADRDRAGHLGVADRREAGREAGEQERDHDGRAGVRHRLRQDEEDAGADGRADAEHHQRERAEVAAELGSGVLTQLVAGIRVWIGFFRSSCALRLMVMGGLPPARATCPTTDAAGP